MANHYEDDYDAHYESQRQAKEQRVAHARTGLESALRHALGDRSGWIPISTDQFIDLMDAWEAYKKARS